MRPGQRLNLKSAVAVFAVSLRGLGLVAPLAWNDTSLSPRARYTLVGPGFLLVLASTVYLDAVRRDAPCCLFFAIACGFVVWPLAAVPLAGISVASLWTLACRYPDTVERGAIHTALCVLLLLFHPRCKTHFTFNPPPVALLCFFGAQSLRTTRTC